MGVRSGIRFGYCCYIQTKRRARIIRHRPALSLLNSGGLRKRQAGRTQQGGLKKTV